MHNATGHLTEQDESQTDDICGYWGSWAQIQRRKKVLRVNSRLANGGIFFFVVAALGVTKMLPATLFQPQRNHTELKAYLFCFSLRDSPNTVAH